MIKIKMNELLNIVNILNKIGSYDAEDINIQFKLKIMMLNKNLNEYINQYSIALRDLINKYKIGIIDNQFSCEEDKNKLNEFLKLKYELEDTDLEVNQSK